MLQASWESHATTLANAGGPQALVEAALALVSALGVDLARPASVVYAHDTRPSCPRLVSALESGLRAFEPTTAIAAGLKTTPQLHYLVRCLNERDSPAAYGLPTEEGYYEKLSRAFIALNVRYCSRNRTLTFY